MTVRGDPNVKLVWPWDGHEACQVHRLSIDGVVCGRICKRCNVVQVFLIGPPGGGDVEGTFDIERVPSGSA